MVGLPVLNREMLTKYRKEMALRKKLHNELVDLKVCFCGYLKK